MFEVPASPCRIRVLAMMEARTVTGPAKNLIAFATRARTSSESGVPPVDLSVVSFERPSATGQAFYSALERAGVPYHLITEKSVGDLQIVSQLRRIVREQNPDIIQTHTSKSHFLVRALGITRRIPWVAFHHGFTTTDRKDQVYNRIAGWALKGAPQLVAVCKAFAGQLQAMGIPDSHITVRHNSVRPIAPLSPEERTELRRSLGIPDGNIVLLAIGRLSSEKGHRDLIDAVARLDRSHPGLPFTLLLVGDGPERMALVRQAAELGIGNELIMPGHQENIQPFYGIADLFILPSHSEGSPNVLLEAMSARLPIVATAVGGSVEIVRHEKTALLTRAHSPEALSAAISRLLTDRALATYLASAAESESRQYTPEAYTRAVIGVYEQVLNGSRSSSFARIGYRSAV